MEYVIMNMEKSLTTQTPHAKTIQQQMDAFRTILTQQTRITFIDATDKNYLDNLIDKLTS